MNLVVLANGEAGTEIRLGHVSFAPLLSLDERGIDSLLQTEAFL